MDWNRNGSTLFHDQNRDGPPMVLLFQYMARYQLTHPDHCPVDVDSILWLTGQSSTLEYLSLTQKLQPDPSERTQSNPTDSYLNATVPLLDALRQSIRNGQRTFGDFQEIPLFIQMEWMQNYETPPEIMHCWSVISRFLYIIQGVVPEEDYQANQQWMDQWFNAVHSFWGSLLKEVRNHLFFRKFRRIEDIPRFQHSIRWSMFFYMFQTDGDPPEAVALKEKFICNPVFKKGIRDFIETVEMALDTINPISFSSLNVSYEDDLEMDVEVTVVLDALKRDDWYQLWWSELFVDSLNRWRSILLDALVGDITGNPKKEVLAASLLWDVEALVAYIEPIFFKNQRVHRVLLSLRKRIRSHILRVVLKEC